MTAFLVMKEALDAVLKDRRSLLWHLCIPLLGLTILGLSWPDESLADFLETGTGPTAFSSTTLVFAVFIFGISGAFTLDRIPRGSVYAFDKWIRYTPVGVFSFIHGRLLFHLVHSLILTVLTVPALMSAGFGSLAPPGQVLSVAGIIFSVSLCQRIAADAGRKTSGSTGSLAYLIYFLVLLTYLLLSHATFPDWSVIAVLRELSRNQAAALSLPALLKTLVLHLTIAVIGYLIALWRLYRAARVVRAS